MSPSRSGAMRSSGPAVRGTSDDLSASRERGPDFVSVGPPIYMPPFARASGLGPAVFIQRKILP